MIKLSVKALIIRRGKILLLKPRITQNSIKGWDGPGGHVRKGESLWEALAREVFEETGLNLKTAFPIKLLQNPQNNKEYLIFLCTVNKGKIMLSKEHVYFKWVALKDLKRITGIDLSKELVTLKNFMKKIFL
ncbi:MAG: hypothetical protein KatS3mg035_2094 [Bacteroidia bacterium]|nr:MAG: hypothetical protein KatS3mg035_2094 [Bacteroidia bacterium]